MATQEERLKILDMVREGKISAEEGTRLLNALQTGDQKSSTTRDPRWLRIRVTDLKSGQTKVNVNIPMSLVSVGIKMGARFTPAGTNLNYAEVIDAIKSGSMGKSPDIENHI